MLTLAINRLGHIEIKAGKGLDAAQKAIFLSELAKLGYRLTNPELLDEADPDILRDYDLIMKTLEKKRGGNVRYVPLFSGFPESVPNDRKYLFKRILSDFQHTVKSNLMRQTFALDLQIV